MLFSQQSPVPFTAASIPYSGMNTGTASPTGLFQQPLIAAPPVVQPSQDSQYKMAAGTNPFSDFILMTYCDNFYTFLCVMIFHNEMYSAHQLEI